MSNHTRYEVLRIFSRIASYYDFLNRILSFNSDILWRKKFISGAYIRENALVLDLCTGTAEIAIECARSKKRCLVFGVDFSYAMLAEAREKIKLARLRNRIHLINSDVFNLPFPPESFDVVSVSFGLRNLVDYYIGLKEMASMTKKGGQVIILEFCPPTDNIIGKAYDFYLRIILPFIARIFGGKLGAYRYLSTSINTFLSPVQIMNYMGMVGLKKLSTRKICFGIVSAYYGEK